MKNLALILASAVLFTGCASQPVSMIDPAAVQVMPNDCANRVATLRWLETQAAIPRSSLESQKQYEINQAIIKKRLWSVRYNCQPV
jgi:PBP1b-binding outer membrane lipoprotein LpoB